MIPLYSIDELRDVAKYGKNKKVKIYGAGFRTKVFLKTLKKFDIDLKVECIAVADISKNPKTVKDIPVFSIEDADLSSDDYLLLTAWRGYLTDDDLELLDKTGAKLFHITHYILDLIIYEEVYEDIKPLIENYSEMLSGLNQPTQLDSVVAWSMWWQGEGEAPDVIKACWESKKRNLPKNVKQIIITQDNYKEYIEIPDYIMEKVNAGSIRLTHLSDIIRAILLYKYGGIWMDAAILMTAPMPEECLELPIYTRNSYDGNHPYYARFCSDLTWSISFFCAKPGNLLFQFWMEAFFYYFKKNNKLKYYLTSDYVISIATNAFPQVREQFLKIPFNNVREQDIRDHCYDKYTEEKYQEYTLGNFIISLDRNCTAQGKETMIDYILDKYKTDENDCWRGKAE
jgi:hypothetical protein